MNQTSVFDVEIDGPETQLRNNPRPTEVSGAKAGLPKSGTHRRFAYDMIVGNKEHGATSDEISKELEWEGMYVPPNQVASRVGELVRDGFVKDSGVTRVTRRGGDAIVWVLRT